MHRTSQELDRKREEIESKRARLKREKPPAYEAITTENILSTWYRDIAFEEADPFFSLVQWLNKSFTYYEWRPSLYSTGQEIPRLSLDEDKGAYYVGFKDREGGHKIVLYFDYMPRSVGYGSPYQGDMVAHVSSRKGSGDSARIQGRAEKLGFVRAVYFATAAAALDVLSELNEDE